jgi:hypothetical protein
MTLRPVLVFSVAVLLACAGIEPESGDYKVTIDDFELSDACVEAWDMDPEPDQGQTVEVDVSDDTIAFGDSIACDRDGLAFACELDMEQSADGVDMLVSVTSRIDGEFLSATRFEAVVSDVLACSGSDCGDYASRCQVDYVWAGEREE